jgi:integrase
MPRKRNAENMGLPLRWKKTHGAYYYQVPQGLEALWDGKKTFRLGKTLPEAYRAWAARLESIDGAKTIGALLDRYALEVVPTKAVRTQVENQRAVARLRKPFGAMPLSSIRPQHLYIYVDKAKMRIPAMKEVKLFSHVFTKAVEWGYIDRHPFKGQIVMEGPGPRDRYVEDWEIIECLALGSKQKKGSVVMLQNYIRLKLLTGISRGDMLRLEPAKDFTEQGIRVQRHKTTGSTGKTTIYEWTPDLRAAVESALASRPVHIAPWLFCTRKGTCYIHDTKETTDGWDSMWQRFMDRVLKETKVTKRFTEHDLRAKCASDADSLEHARSLLSHADSAVTKRIYRRKPEHVKPLKQKF